MEKLPNSGEVIHMPVRGNSITISELMTRLKDFPEHLEVWIGRETNNEFDYLPVIDTSVKWDEDEQNNFVVLWEE